MSITNTITTVKGELAPEGYLSPGMTDLTDIAFNGGGPFVNFKTDLNTIITAGGPYFSASSLTFLYSPSELQLFGTFALASGASYPQSINAIVSSTVNPTIFSTFKFSSINQASQFPVFLTGPSGISSNFYLQVDSSGVKFCCVPGLTSIPNALNFQFNVKIRAT